MRSKEKYVSALSYDFLTPLYDPLIGLAGWEKTFKADLRRHAAIKPDERVLDLACGTGTMTVAFKKEQPEAQIYGLDGDARILSIAEEKAVRNGVTIEFTNAISTNMPYADGFFDCVVTSLFFHHLTRENKIKTLEEILRILKSGERLLIADWGKAASFQTRLSQRVITWLDGETTRDSFEGRLPSFITEVGFDEVQEIGMTNTIGGTVRLHKAVKK